MLLLRAPPSPPPLSAATFSANLDGALRLPGLSSSRAAVAASAAAAKWAASSRVGQKRKQVASVANPLAKHCVKLRLSAAYRRSCRRLLLVGLAPILERCRFELNAIDCLLLLDGLEVPEELREFTGDVVYVSAAVMKKVSGMQSVDSTEAIAIMHMPKHFRDLGSEEDGDDLHGLFNHPKRILVLDGIQDPGNLGTLIRSACAFRWDGVFLLPACCDPFNEKALRAARGASLQLPIVSGNWHDLHALTTKYGMKMMAGHPESNSDKSKVIQSLSKELADSLLNEPLCLVLGSEGSGLSAETLQACELVNIPMEGCTDANHVTVYFITVPTYEMCQRLLKSSCASNLDLTCSEVQTESSDGPIMCSEARRVGVPATRAIWQLVSIILVLLVFCGVLERYSLVWPC